MLILCESAILQVSASTGEACMRQITERLCELTKNLIRLTKTEELAVQVHQFAIYLRSLLTHFSKEGNVISNK